MKLISLEMKKSPSIIYMSLHKKCTSRLKVNVPRYAFRLESLDNIFEKNENTAMKKGLYRMSGSLKYYEQNIQTCAGGTH